MTRTVTPPNASIPVGLIEMGGKRIEVKQHPEFVRFFFDLFARIGGVSALTNTELEALAQALIDAGAVPASSPEAQEALRGVEDLRQQLSSLRGDNDRLRSELDELRSLIEPVPSLQPLEFRVSQIEDRLQ